MAADRSRLAAALAYEEERRRRMMESVPGLVTTPAQPAPRADFRTNLENLSIGLGEGLTNQLEGVKGIITDPVGTAKGVYEAGRAAIRDPSVIADALRYTAQKATSGPLGAGEVIGEMLGPRKGGPMMQELDVYHGTPHRFPATEANPLGEFDASKIGTGEGAQAYGHGIYYAENPDVAKGYQSTLRETNAWEIDGQRVHGVRSRSDAQPINYAANALERFDGDKKAAIAWLKDSESPWDLEAAQLLAKSKTAQKAPGSLYKADLPDEMIDRMLDWDKPLSEQPAAVREAIETRVRHSNSSRKFLLTNPTGEQLYDMFSDRGDHRNPIEAAAAFKEAGIPGIKFQDAGSRGQGGSGTRNFVVFPGEEKKVRILERDGQKAPPQKIAQALEAAPSKAAKAEPQPFGVQGYLNDDLRRVKQNFFSQYGVEENKQFSKDYEVVELAKLKPSENINESKIQSLMKTMREEGNARDNPIPPIIVDSEGNILDGHHRYEAAKRLGAKYVPIVELFDKRKGPVFSE